MVSDFHFGRFSTLRIERLGQTNRFYRKGRMVRILVFIFFNHYSVYFHPPYPPRSYPQSLSQIRWKWKLDPIGPHLASKWGQKPEKWQFMVPNLHEVPKHSYPPSLSQIWWKLRFGPIWPRLIPFSAKMRSKNLKNDNQRSQSSCGAKTLLLTKFEPNRVKIKVWPHLAPFDPI